MKFHPGDRVRISTEHHWAQGTLGTIDEPPVFAQRLVEDESLWEGCHRFVQGVQGPIEFYWINFDEPQIDQDGDGPYTGGEIEARMIELLSH